MHTSSSAKRTCREFSSASEYTATVLIPSSRHAMMTRIATSPRLAIRIFLNIASGFYREQPFPVLDGLPVLDIHTDHLSVIFRIDLVHQLHRFDDAEDLPLLHDIAHFHKCRGAGLRRSEERADDRGLHHGEIDFGVARGSLDVGLASIERGNARRSRIHLRRRRGYDARGRGKRLVDQHALFDLDFESVALELELAQLVLANHLQNSIQLVQTHAFGVSSPPHRASRSRGTLVSSSPPSPVTSTSSSMRTPPQPGM